MASLLIGENGTLFYFFELFLRFLTLDLLWSVSLTAKMLYFVLSPLLDFSAANSAFEPLCVGMVSDPLKADELRLRLCGGNGSFKSVIST